MSVGINSDIRGSGINIIRNIPWGKYICQFCPTEEDLMATLIPYLKTGIENNEFCMKITSNPLESREALTWAVPDIDINLEVRDILESKRVGDEIRRRIEKLSAASKELERFNCSIWIVKCGDRVTELNKGMNKLCNRPDEPFPSCIKSIGDGK